MAERGIRTSDFLVSRMRVNQIYKKKKKNWQSLEFEPMTPWYQGIFCYNVSNRILLAGKW